MAQLHAISPRQWRNQLHRSARRPTALIQGARDLQTASHEDPFRLLGELIEIKREDGHGPDRRDEAQEKKEDAVQHCVQVYKNPYELSLEKAATSDTNEGECLHKRSARKAF